MFLISLRLIIKIMKSIQILEYYIQE